MGGSLPPCEKSDYPETTSCEETWASHVESLQGERGSWAPCSYSRHRRHQACEWWSHLRWPASVSKWDDSSPICPLTTNAQENPSGKLVQSTQELQEIIINCCVKPLSLGMVCCVVVKSWNRAYKQMSGWFHGGWNGPWRWRWLGIIFNLLSWLWLWRWSDGLRNGLSVSSVGPFNQGEDPLPCPGITLPVFPVSLGSCLHRYLLLSITNGPSLGAVSDSYSSFLCLANTYYTQLGEMNLGYKCIFKII